MLLLKESFKETIDIDKSFPDVQEMLKNQLEKNKEQYFHFSSDTKDTMVELETNTQKIL